MFEYFPQNYIWNAAVVSALNSGGLVDEVDRACRPLRDLARQGSDVGTAALMTAWGEVAEQLAARARAERSAGHRRTAEGLFYRASVYVGSAERMLSVQQREGGVQYRRCMELLAASLELGDGSVTRVEIPYEGTSLPAYYCNASADGRRVPVMVLWNGLDSTKEMLFSSGFHRRMASKGISTLIVDCPGSGEAIRLRGLRARPDTEVWAAACVDWLQSRSDVARDLIGLVGISLGGYYAPRAAAFEKRLALCVAWGGNHDWGAVQLRRLRREGEHPVPHYWDHVRWVWGAPDLDSFIETARRVNLDGVVERIDVPFLVVHGANDRQIPVEYAQRSYDQATSSPHRELRVFGVDEGGSEHVGMDHLPLVTDFIADWVGDVVDELALSTTQDPDR